MDRDKLIARTMRREYPFVVGKTDRYSSGDCTLFQGWARSGKREFSSPADEALDAGIANEAEAFLRKHPLALLLAAQLDQGKPAWKAWRGPYLVANDLGWKAMRPKRILSYTTAQLAASLRRCRLGCRTLSHKKAGRNLRGLAGIVAERYAGRADRAWTTPSTFDELKANMNLPGIGVGISNMMIKFFVEFGMVPQIRKTKSALATLQLKPDTHVIHVFYRAGLIKKRTASATLRAAARLAPDLPAALDAAGWHIGSGYCHKDIEPECDECPIGFKTNGERLCPRRRVR